MRASTLVQGLDMSLHHNYPHTPIKFVADFHPFFRLLAAIFFKKFNITAFVDMWII